MSSISDPISRQYQQNINICLLSGLAIIAAFLMILICKAPSPTFNPADLTEQQRLLRRILFDFAVPTVMAGIILGSVLIILTLRW